MRKEGNTTVTIQYNTIQYNTIQDKTIQYNTKFYLDTSGRKVMIAVNP